MKRIQNEKGLTLIEVLASIVILTIVLLSIMNFFPQIGFMNEQNEDNSQAVNTAKQVLINWEEDPNLQDFLNGTSSSAALSVPPLDNSDPTYYYFQTTSNNFSVSIKIAKNPPAGFPSGSTSLRYIQVHVQDPQTKVVSDTYGYITLD